MKKSILILSLIGIADMMPSFAQRQISSFREVTTTGNYATIAGERYSEPDIYYFPQEDGTYEAVRLTMQPKEATADITVPYLNMSAPTSICVNWKTKTQADGSVVKYGLSPDNLDKTCQPSDRKITDTYFWNTATLTGLTPDTPYFYQVISNGTESEVYRFRTPRLAGDKSKLRVLVIGDHQRNEHSDYEWLLSAARRKVQEKYGDAPFEDNIAFLLNDGDQVDGGLINLYEKVHLFKSRSVSPYLPNMTVVGNHEYKSDPELALYDGHFHEYASLEYNGIASGNSGYYAYQNGSVLFIALNSDDPSAEQKFWIRKVIAAADADNSVQFVVSVQHRPLYAEQWSGDVSAWMLNEIMPILSSTPKHVLNIAGHHHLYARGQMTDTPVYHIITGGGVGTSAEGYEQLWGKTPDNQNHPEVQKTIDHWTYQILEFDPETATMTAECYSIGNSRLALDNELVDTFSRTLTPASPPSVPALTVEDGETATFSISTGLDPIHTVQYEVSADPSFESPVHGDIATFEDYYGANEDFTPKNINDGKNLRSLSVPTGSVPAGSYYLRVRNRSMNLDWSGWSEPVQFTVASEGAAPSLAVSERFYRTGSNIHIDYTGAPVNTDAWIGIYKENHNPGPDPSQTYVYTSGADNSWDFTMNAPGAYYAVMFKNGGYDVCTPRVYFVVSANCDSETIPTLSTDKLVYNTGDPVVVQLHNAPCIQNDWVGLYDSSVAVVKDGKSHSYAYVGSDPQGEVKLNVPGNYNYSTPVGDGVYYVTYCIDNEYFEPAERSFLVVGKPVIIEAGKAQYVTSEEVLITYEGAPGWNTDRIQLFTGEELIGEFPTGATGGSISVGQLEPGTYEACVVTLEDNEISQRITISVANDIAANASWMTGLSDKAYVHQISIPGTHDAGTGNGTTMDTFARTQELGLSDQFDAGIRAFDLRPSVDDNSLKIYHGIIATEISFENALDQLCDKLEENPTEFVVVVMRHEDDHENDATKAQWNELMEQTLTAEKYAPYMVEFKPDLTVEEARGKILVLSRDKYASTPVGGYITGWTHSSSFNDQGNALITGASARIKAQLYVQDFYETKDAMDTKLQSITTLLDYSVKLNEATDHVWVINHTSGYSQISFVATADAYRLNAASTNKAVADYLSDEAKAGPTGLVMMDFAGVDKSGSYDVEGRRLTDAIIRNNFLYEPRTNNTLAIENISNSEQAVNIIGNTIMAIGRIDVYTLDGKLYSSASDRLTVATPGIYILHAAGTTSKLVVK